LFADGDDDDSVSDMDVSIELDQDVSLGLEKLNISPTTSSSKKEKEKREFISLEAINPFEISWDLLNDIGQSNTTKRSTYRDTKYRMPEPPTTKSGICK